MLLSNFFVYANAQEDNEGAELAIKIVGNLPFIEIGKDNIIKLEFEDRFGLNWTSILDKFGWFIPKLEWPFLFGQDVKKYLGYSSVDFYGEVVNNVSGWHAFVDPSEVSKTTGGMKANLTLHVRVDKLSTSSYATIRIKCIRRLANGETEGPTFAYISLKAKPQHYAEIDILQTVKEAAPGSIIYFPVDITNKGNFVDTFQFKPIEEEDGLSGVISGQSIVLSPGETQRVYLQIATPRNFVDFGTPREIKVKAYSVNYPNETFIGNAAIVTRGINMESPAAFILLFIIVIIAIAFIIYKRYRNKSLPSTKKSIEKKSNRQHTKEMIQKENITVSERRVHGNINKKIAKIQREQERQKRKLQK